MNDLERLAMLGRDLSKISFTVPDGVKIASRYYWKRIGQDFAKADAARQELLDKESAGGLSIDEKEQLFLLRESIKDYVRNDPKNTWLAEQSELSSQGFNAYMRVAQRIIRELG